MTTNEFDLEFDVLYDSIASLGAPDLDKYEKSVFLTKAQLELVKEVNGNQNKYGTSFEGSDKRRADMRELIKNTSITPVKNITSGLSLGYSYTADLPSDAFLIKYEAGHYSDSCGEHVIDIKPLKYDEYHEMMRNPFRKPDYQNGFRLDIESLKSTILGVDTYTKRVELISTKPIASYQLRYIKYPTPIVLTDLSGISGSDTLLVDGVSVETQCRLDQQFHREILDRAVQLAMLAYKPESLGPKVQLDQRNN